MLQWIQNNPTLFGNLVVSACMIGMTVALLIWTIGCFMASFDDRRRAQELHEEKLRRLRRRRI